jgi:hypothetical protein
MAIPMLCHGLSGLTSFLGRRGGGIGIEDDRWSLSSGASAYLCHVTDVPETPPFKWSGDKLTLPDLDVWARDLITKGAPPGTAKFANAINTSVIVHYLGFKWHEDHSFLTSPERSFLHPTFEDDGKAREWSVYFLNLAEMLINLQDIENFQVVLDHLRLDQLESAICELQSGMILKQEGIPFRYIDPLTISGPSPDIELTLSDGTRIGAEITCKSDSTDMTEGTITRGLKHGSSKFAKGDKGMIIMRVPQSWTYQLLN